MARSGSRSAVAQGASGPLEPGRRWRSGRTIATAFIAIGHTVTALLLYFLLRRGNRRLEVAHKALELREVEDEAERSRIERIARIGHWTWHPEPQQLEWQGGHIEHSESAAAIFGVRPADLAISNREYLDRFVYPPDRERATKAFAALDRG